MKNKSCYIEFIIDVPDLTQDKIKYLDSDSSILLLGIDIPKIIGAVKVPVVRMTLGLTDTVYFGEVIHSLEATVYSTRFRGILDPSWWSFIHDVSVLNKTQLMMTFDMSEHIKKAQRRSKVNVDVVKEETSND